jgi:hypothetical protein
MSGQESDLVASGPRDQDDADGGEQSLLSNSPYPGPEDIDGHSDAGSVTVVTEVTAVPVPDEHNAAGSVTAVLKLPLCLSRTNTPSMINRRPGRV